MLDIANKYEKELQALFMDTWYDEKYKYYHAAPYSELHKEADSNWNAHSFVSKDHDGKIIGLIKYSINRESEMVTGFSIINFTENKLTFGRDVTQVLRNIFEKFNFRKLGYCVVIGNPVEKSYDKITKKYGGRVIGTFKEDVRLIDNKFYDIKYCEVFREDYLKSMKGSKKALSLVSSM